MNLPTKKLEIVQPERNSQLKNYKETQANGSTSKTKIALKHKNTCTKLNKRVALADCLLFDNDKFQINEVDEVQSEERNSLDDEQSDICIENKKTKESVVEPGTNKLKKEKTIVKKVKSRNISNPQSKPSQVGQSMIFQLTNQQNDVRASCH